MSQPHFIRIVFALALLVACKGDASTTGAGAQEAMGFYAEGFNTLIREPKEMIKTYFDAIPDAGPDDKSNPHLFPYRNLNAFKQARAAFDKAKAAAPKSLTDLGPAADQAVAAAERLQQAYAAAQTYYEGENYKDDQFAKGKELHTQMVAATKDYRAAIGKLETGLSKIEDAQATQELAKFADAKGYSYWFRHFNIEAKNFLNAVEAVEAPEQLAALEAAFQPVATAHEQLDKFVAGKAQGINTTFGSYAGQASSFHATGSKLIRLTKAAKLDSAAYDREQQALIERYNGLIDMGNALYKLEAAKMLK